MDSNRYNDYSMPRNDSHYQPQQQTQPQEQSRSQSHFRTQQQQSSMTLAVQNMRNEESPKNNIGYRNNDHYGNNHGNNNVGAAALRYEADRRQIGAMLLPTGLCAIIQPLSNISILVNPGQTPGTGGAEDIQSVPFWSLLGSCFVAIIGILSFVCGYFELIHDRGSRIFTGSLIVILQTAFIPYIVDMTDVAQKAMLPAEENVFIPLAYNPTDEDVKFVGSVGVVLVFVYGFTFIGSIAFMLFSLFAFQAGKPEHRTGRYYNKRLIIYSFMLGLSGLCQLMLGLYLITNNANEQLSALESGPISITPFIQIHFPIMTTIIGILQLFNGLWGWARSVNVGHYGPEDISYAVSMMLLWIFMLVLQVVQISYAPNEELAHLTSSAAVHMLGLILMPAFLDQKYRSMPAEFPENYYHVGESEDRWVDED